MVTCLYPSLPAADRLGEAGLDIVGGVGGESGDAAGLAAVAGGAGLDGGEEGVEFAGPEAYGLRVGEALEAGEELLGGVTVAQLCAEGLAAVGEGGVVEGVGEGGGVAVEAEEEGAVAAEVVVGGGGDFFLGR